MVMPKMFIRSGELYYRVSIIFTGGRYAPQVRAFVHDVVIRAHGLRTARRLTKALAVKGGLFRVAIARRAVKALKRRLLLLIDAGLIKLFVGGRRVFTDA
ncbi:hypothetical protein NKJ36_25045 [Mesorhizobium sp. M0142]|uniref:hypothetical protein n=1 Tax=unclassified Mesorhizobium TaxID=325217 RepID=UPI00333BA13C